MRRWRTGSAIRIFLGTLTLWPIAPGARADPSLLSAADNVAYAVGALCAPFVLDHVDQKALPLSRDLVHPDGYDFLGRPDPQALRIGFAGFVHVVLSERNGNRSCDVGAKDEDPQVLRKAALDALAKAAAFVPTRSRYLPGRFQTEDMMCGSAEGPHRNAFILLSASPPQERNRIAILFTLAEGPRMAGCDSPGVRLNYRALADPQ